MDNLMKLVTTALELSYAEEKRNVDPKHLELAAEALTLRRDTIHLIDAVGGNADAKDQNKASAGRLCKVLVTTANGAKAILIYDNSSAASGMVIGVVAASAAVGTIYDFQMPAANGITIASTASAGTITVSYS